MPEDLLRKYSQETYWMLPTLSPASLSGPFPDLFVGCPWAAHNAPPRTLQWSSSCRLRVPFASQARLAYKPFSLSGSYGLEEVAS